MSHTGRAEHVAPSSDCFSSQSLSEGTARRVLLALEVQGHCRGVMGTVGLEFKDSFPKGGCSPDKALGSTLCPRPSKIASVLPFNTCERGPFLEIGEM